MKYQRQKPAMARVLTIVLIASVAAISGTAVGQEREWNSIVAAAKKEGRVALYAGTAPTIVDRITAGFKKAYPEIAIEPTISGGGQLISRIDQERISKADGADVALTTEIPWFISLARDGALLRPTGPAAREWPAAFLRENSIAIVGLEPFVISYNTKLVPNPPSSYADLLKPEYKDKLGTVELAATILLAWYDWLEKTQGNDYLVKLKGQNPKLYPSSPMMIQANGSGELPISVFMNASSVTPLLEKGAPIARVVPKPGLGVQYATAVMSWSKRPNAALVLLDYMMSRAGQSAWHSKNDTASPLSGISGSLQASDITLWNPGDYPPEKVKAFSEHWNAIFKR